MQHFSWALYRQFFVRRLAGDPQCAPANFTELKEAWSTPSILCTEPGGPRGSYRPLRQRNPLDIRLWKYVVTMGASCGAGTVAEGGMCVLGTHAEMGDQ